MKERIYNLVVISLFLVALIFIYNVFFVPEKVTHYVEEATVTNKYTSFPKVRVYHIEVKTKDTNRIFEFTADEHTYNSIKVNDILKIEYNYNYFKYSENTISDVFIISK